MTGRMCTVFWTKKAFHPGNKHTLQTELVGLKVFNSRLRHVQFLYSLTCWKSSILFHHNEDEVNVFCCITSCRSSVPWVIFHALLPPFELIWSAFHCGIWRSIFLQSSLNILINFGWKHIFQMKVRNNGTIVSFLHFAENTKHVHFKSLGNENKKWLQKNESAARAQTCQMSHVPKFIVLSQRFLCEAQNFSVAPCMAGHFVWTRL